MALTYGFYNSSNGDRRYNAIQMSSIFDGIIKDGIFMSIGTAMMVKAGTGMTVLVGEGRSWFNHSWTLNDAEMPIEIPQAEVLLNRIDSIVIDVDAREAVRANSIKVIKGAPSSNPAAPTMIRTADHNQYALCNIYVAKGATSITQANITNLVGTGSTPFITGILQTINIDSLVAQWADQWQIFYAEMTTAVGIDYNAFLAYLSSYKVSITTHYETFLSYLEGFRTDSTEVYSLLLQWFNAFKVQATANFEELAASIHDILDEEAAGNLLLLIQELQADRPTATIGTVTHTLGRYPHCTLYRVDYALDVGGFNMGPLGGSNMVTIPAVFEIEEFDKVTVTVPQAFAALTDIDTDGNNTFSFSNPDSVTSLLLILE